MTYRVSSQKHQVQHQDHSMNMLMLAEMDDSEDEAMEEALAVEKALAVAMELLLVTTMGL